MKPIEAGCLAVIVNSYAGNDGLCVTVGEYIGEVLGFHGKDRWAVDKTLNTTWGDRCKHSRECQLLRIDGGEFEQEKELMELGQ